MKKIVIGIIIVIAFASGLFINSNRSADNSLPQSSNNEESTQVPSTSGKSLDYSNKGLKEVPGSVFDDKSATSLDVSGNNLTGSLQGEIRKMSNLEVLDASDNKMTGIPAEIGQLSKLRVANFANNDLSGIPLEIGNLKNLETLDLRGNPNISKYDISQIQPKIPNAKILVD